MRTWFRSIDTNRWNTASLSPGRGAKLVKLAAVLSFHLLPATNTSREAASWNALNCANCSPKQVGAPKMTASQLSSRSHGACGLSTGTRNRTNDHGRVSLLTFAFCTIDGTNRRTKIPHFCVY
jgi:hypothetical protein